MYSIVILAAMSATPETQDFCLKNKGKQQNVGSVAPKQKQIGHPKFSQPNHGGAKGFMGSNLFCSNTGGGNGCNFLGSDLFRCGHGGFGGGCNILDSGLFAKFFRHGERINFIPAQNSGPTGRGVVILGYNNAPQADGAVVVVLMPATGKLIANGQPTEGKGTTRSFQTPVLAVGQEFRYEMQVEIEEDGNTRTLTKQVMVRAGHSTTVDFTEKVNTAVTVTLPAKAKLLVDGTDTLMTGGTHTFNTPVLAKGQAFSYKFRAEIEKDGKMEVVTQDVSFKAGEAVTVDFTTTATVSK
ncbi:MAG: TIGR03000 domain-containing protein [Gemmataceae bacterium]|nr:TIGR03000 domain-containing protein [Gemmataceae bacterium]